MNKIYEVDSSDIPVIIPVKDLIINRKKCNDLNSNNMESDVTIAVQAYNRLEKTKECVNSILKYTKDVNYDLILIDNGSSDETLEYFKSVNYPKKRIIRITKNISSSFPAMCYDLSWISDFFVSVANDLVFTPRWLSNMLTVAKSDYKIGMVNPVSSNVSNMQQINLPFRNMNEMEEQANIFNKSNPSLWQERLRLITLGTLYKKECLLALGWPYFDIGFYHDFVDDDITFRVRRAGYKAVLAGDTWIHHNHDFRNNEDKNPEEYRESLEIGRKNFRDKYFGIDAWDDVNNYVPEYQHALNPYNKEHSRILGIDVRCGTPILDIKNQLRHFGIFNADCYAYTRKEKYLIDLQTVCGADNVFSGSANDICHCFNEHYFDQIIIGDDINSYHEPFRVIDDAYKLLNKGGQLFISLKNVYDIFALLNMVGKDRGIDQSHVINYSVEQFLGILSQYGYSARYISARQYNLSSEAKRYVNDCMNQLAGDGAQESAFRLMVDRYYFVISGEI